MAHFRGMTFGFGALVAVSVCLVPACGSDDGTNNGQNGLTAGTSGTSGASGNSGTSGGGTSGNGGGGVSGQNVVGTNPDAGNFVWGNTQCSDGKDNDGDGLIDGFDPECTGPADNDESSFATGIPGDNVDACKQDCFFDGNSGQGDDGCNWELKCDPKSPGGSSCPYDPSYKNCPTQQSQRCIDYCTQFIPNGCDCFGCCSIYTNGGSPVDIIIGSACSVDKISDTTACPRCTKSTTCANDCGTCELCLGKTAADLPASCAPTPNPDAGPPAPDAAPPPPAYTCNTGQKTCTTTADCDPTTQYCSQGCCLTAPH